MVTQIDDYLSKLYLRQKRLIKKDCEEYWASLEKKEKDLSGPFTANQNYRAKLKLFALPAMGGEFDRKAGILTKGDM